MNPSDCLSLACCCSQFSLLSVFSYLVACFAAELPGTTKRGRKDRNTQNSQSLSNNALFEVNAQLKLQNQGLMSLLATQQSSREHGMSSVGLQTETQPLDMVDLASVNTAWDIVKNKKEQVRDPSAKAAALNSSGRDVCQNKKGERPTCQRACSGRLFSSCGKVCRRFPFGRFWCLSGLAKRGGGGNSRAALESGTDFPHDKEHFRFGGGRIRSQDCPGATSNMEAILGTIGLHSCHVQMHSAKRCARGDRHSTCGGRISQTALSLRWVEDGNDQASAQLHISSGSLEWNQLIFHRQDLESAKVSK